VIILCALLAVREQDYFIFPISLNRKLVCVRARGAVRPIPPEL